jgi:hypothetical protein
MKTMFAVCASLKLKITTLYFAQSVFCNNGIELEHVDV